MTIHTALTLAQPIYSGTSPLAMARGKFKYKGYAAGDVVRLRALWQGCFIYETKLFHEALGAGVKIKLGLESIESGALLDDLFIAESDASSAGVKAYGGKPYLLHEDCYLVATITGAAATGEIETTTMYEPTE